MTQLNSPIRQSNTAARVAASALWKQNRDESLRATFGDLEFTFGKDALKEVRNNLTKAAILAAPQVKAVRDRPAAPAAADANTENFFRASMHISRADIMAALGDPETMATIAGEVAPFVGILTSFKKAGTDWYSVITNYRDKGALKPSALNFAEGNATAAFQAIQKIVQANLIRDTTSAVRNTAVLGAKIAGVLGDLGTGSTAIIGLANSIATITATLVSLGMDIREKIAANALLAHPEQLDLNAFKVSPLLGCYFLTCSNTSHILALTQNEIQGEGAPIVAKVEAMRKAGLDNVINIAKKQIASSRLQLLLLKDNRGTKMESGANKWEMMKKMEANRGQAGHIGAARAQGMVVVDFAYSGQGPAANPAAMLQANNQQKFNDQVRSSTPNPPVQGSR